MTKIIAICPYCRRGGVRAQPKAIGSIAPCPKCKTNFTILPEDDLPDWAAKANPEAESFYQSSSPLAETRANAKLQDRTEPSPIVRADPKPKKKAKNKEESKESKPEPAPTQTPTQTPEAAAAPASTLAAPQQVPESDSEDSLRRAPADMGMVFALLVLILVGPTMLVSQVPYGRVIAIALAVIGMLGGLLCLGSEGRARLTAAAGAFLHFVALLILLFLPSWLNLDPWSDESSAVQEGEVKKIPVVVEHGSGAARPVSANDWVDAGRTSWQFRDTRVTVNTTVGPVALSGPNGAKRTTKESYFQLTVKVTNIGAEREIPLSGWAAGQNADGVRVTTSDGRELKLATFEAGWTYDRGKPASRSLPGSASEVHWMFAAPPKSDSIRIYLPGAAVGVQDEIKVRAFTVGVPLR